MAPSVPFLSGVYRPAAVAASAALGAGAFALSSMAEGKGSSAGFLALAFVLHSLLLAAPAGVLVFLAGERVRSSTAAWWVAVLLTVPYLTGAFFWLRSHIPASGEAEPASALTWLTPVFANILVSGPLFLGSIVWIVVRRRQELRAAEPRGGQSHG